MDFQCSKCGKDQPPDNFRRGHKQCLTCEREYGKKRYAEKPGWFAEYREANRERYRKQNVETSRRRKAERHGQIDALKSVPCAECGKSFPSYVMDFDHRDPSQKKDEINFLVNMTTCPWPRILDEIQKCDVVCVNCHRLRHSKGAPPKDARGRLIAGLKSAPCLDCGGQFHSSQMDFDHVRGQKVSEVPILRSNAAILEEAAKCEVVCANCHRVRTQKKVTARIYVSELSSGWVNRVPGTPQTNFVPQPVKPVQFRSWHSLCGTMIDTEVARIGGVTPPNVCMFRRKMGIPTYREIRNA